MPDQWCQAEIHGTEYAYAHRGCRCDRARKVRHSTQRNRRNGTHVSPMRPVWPAARRLRALYALGWSWKDMQDLTGRQWNLFRRLAAMERATVHRDTDTFVRELYDVLSGTAGPSPHARELGASRGWRTPLAWRDIDKPPTGPGERELLQRIAGSPNCLNGHRRSPENTRLAPDGDKYKLECLTCRRDRGKRRRS